MNITHIIGSLIALRHTNRIKLTQERINQFNTYYATKELDAAGQKSYYD